MGRPLLYEGNFSTDLFVVLFAVVMEKERFVFWDMV